LAAVEVEGEAEREQKQEWTNILGRTLTPLRAGFKLLTVLTIFVRLVECRRGGAVRRRLLSHLGRCHSVEATEMDLRIARMFGSRSRGLLPITSYGACLNHLVGGR